MLFTVSVARTSVSSARPRLKFLSGPINIPMHSSHLAASGRLVKLPAGPMVSPRPGPTLATAVAAPVSAVTKSKPSAANPQCQDRNGDKKEERKSHYATGDIAGHRLLVIAGGENSVRMNQIAQLVTQHQHSDLKAENLHATAGGAATATDKRQVEKSRYGKRAPQGVVVRCVACGGDH